MQLATIIQYCIIIHPIATSDSMLPDPLYPELSRRHKMIIIIVIVDSLLISYIEQMILNSIVYLGSYQ